MKKLLNLINIKYYLFAAVLFIGCGKEEPNRNYIARVDDSYLTIQDITSELDTTHLQKSHRNEFIRNWIETEVLFNEAVKEDIVDDDTFKKILVDSRKELAKSFLIKKILSEAEFDYNVQDLEDYYLDNRREFVIFNDSFLYNIITFSDEDKAVLFRNTLIESDWNKTTNVFRGDQSIIREKINVFLNDFQVQPNNLYLVLQNLMSGEVSIILNTEPSYFTIVQLLKKYNKSEIPEFEVISKDVEARYLMEKKREYLSNYIKELYSKYEIEIK